MQKHALNTFKYSRGAEGTRSATFLFGNGAHRRFDNATEEVLTFILNSVSPTFFIIFEKEN